jgi:Fe-S cluster assembly protein SufD
MGEVTLMRTPAETALAEAFEAAKLKLPGDRSAREKAFRDFVEVGLPHRRVEAFKYTDLRAALREHAPFADPPSAAEVEAATAASRAFAGLDAAVITLLNGHVVGPLPELPEGVEIVTIAGDDGREHSLLDALSPVPLARENPLYQLNSAFMTDGLLIRVAAGAAPERPLHLRFLSGGQGALSAATRTLLVIEDGASLTLLESHEGPDGVSSQLNDVIELVVGDEAKIRHVRLSAEGSDALAFSTLAGRLGARAALDTLNVAVGAVLSRHQVYLTFAGEAAEARVNGATMIRGRQHADTTLVIDHAAPHGSSRELFKTVVEDAGTGVFQGKIIVEPKAQKTDGRMMSACLLLSEGGTMNNKPELEIFADDVQCAHGATCGALDEDLLFYLMARGLPKAEAENLMVQAFLGEALEGVEHEGARETLVEVVERWLAARAHPSPRGEGGSSA